MAGFSLGGGRGGGGGGGQDQGIPPESLFLYPGGGGGGGSAATYSRGFELWQHQQIPHHPQQQLYSTAGLLRFSDDPTGQEGQRAGRGGGGASGSTAAGGMSCQDCGNQAKKDCSHLRCRTCCKSRGFQCSTHVKSTWVPASKRRERQQQQLATAAFHRAGAGTSAGGGEPSKRPREIITTTTSGGGMEAVSFPSEVSSPAVFRCVRVSPMDDAEDEYAYQTAVSIGGHVFKGILYNQGPESQYSSTPRGGHQGDSSSSSAAAAVTAAAAIASTSTGTAAGSTGLLDPSSLYPTPLSAFMAGTQFFPHHPRP